MIVDDCMLLGVSLPPIDDINLPRFSLPLKNINYASLISKALHYLKLSARRASKFAKKRELTSPIIEFSEKPQLTTIRTMVENQMGVTQRLGKATLVELKADE